MPTVYTSRVQTGEIRDFATFALQCARAFGALIMMRDEPSDAPIPERFQPSDYNRRAREKAAAELQRLQGLEWDEIVAESIADYNAEVRQWEEYKKQQDAGRQRYEAMLEQVRAWTPPTEEHVGLKEFMVNQLVESIRLDCGFDSPCPSLKTAVDWHSDRIEKARRDVEYHTVEDLRENERIAERNHWIQALRDSLTSGATAPGAGV